MQTKVFISFSGEASMELASHLKQFLRRTVVTINPWMSSDIKRGKIWLQDLLNSLKDAKYGLLCLTPQNLESSWIHFEAGMLAKQIDIEDDEAKVIPILFGVDKSRISEPLKVFQNVEFSRKAILEIVQDINAVSEHEIPEDILLNNFDNNWDHFENSVTETQRKYMKTKEDFDKSKFNDKAALKEVLQLCRNMYRSQQSGKKIRTSVSSSRMKATSKIKQLIADKESDDAIIQVVRDSFPITIGRLGWNEQDLRDLVEKQKKSQVTRPSRPTTPDHSERAPANDEA
ncbi:MAG: toll/interleukin-1 receptor domain-containing protein [Pseudomonadota bacterium]|nr:toll/interleukin-1 receptor domain-containing protein [Pseudomonadota bacterium]